MPTKDESVTSRQNKPGGGRGPRIGRTSQGPARAGWERTAVASRGGRAPVVSNIVRGPALIHHQEIAQRDARQQDATMQKLKSRAAAASEEGINRVQPWTLVDRTWRFQEQRVMKVLSKSADHIVVGMFGADSGSKVAFLDELCGSSPKARNPIPSCEGNELPRTTIEVYRSDTGMLESTQKDIDSRIDIRVTSDRVLVIDTPPVQSLEALSSLMSMDAPPTGLLPTIQSIRDLGDREEPVKTPIAPYEAVAELMDLHMAMWLLRVCHVVCVFGNGPKDKETWRLLSTAAMLLESLPAAIQQPTADAQGAHAAAESNIAEVVVCVGKDPTEAERQAVLQSLKGSCIPILDCATPDDGNYNKLCSQILSSVQKRPLKNGGSEQDWLQGAERIWAAALQSRCLKEYVLGVQNTLYKGAGGWKLM